MPTGCNAARKGKFTVHVGTIRKRLRRGLTAIAEWYRALRHDPAEKRQNHNPWQCNRKVSGIGRDG